MNIYLYEFDKDKIIENEKTLFERLPECRRAKAEKYSNPSVRAVSIAAGLLLVHAIKEETGFTSEDYEIVADENGKPKVRLLSRENVKTGTGIETVDESTPEIHVSLSHSADYAAAIVADSPVGIDIEEKNDRNFMVTKRMYSEVEKDRVFNSANPDKEFQVIWTEKEAYLKCTGEGISVPLKSFYKDSESGEILRLPKTSDSNEEGDKYLQTGLFISSVMTDNPDYSISVCKDEKLALDIQRVSEL